MAEMIADDYAAIAARMAEIKDDARRAETVCLLCLGSGFVDANMACEACGNPEGYTSL